MLKWIDVLRYARKENPTPDLRVEKTAAEWRSQLSAEAFHVTREKGTERPFRSEMCSLFEPGEYTCVCCGTLLFDSTEKFESGTGWPSFTQPAAKNAIAYHEDVSHGMSRIEVTCNSCDAHLGHVFPDGPAPSGLRYCINAVALQKRKSDHAKAVFGGGCFWCTEAIFKEVEGVIAVRSGYSGGKITNPTYTEVCSGLTGHAEVVEITYDPAKVQFEDLVRVHMGTHNPTTLNRQGADVGTQYRSVIFVRTPEEEAAARKVIDEVQAALGKPVVTDVAPSTIFYVAEPKHQDYYANHQFQPYCEAVIEPKLQKFRETFAAIRKG